MLVSSQMATPEQAQAAIASIHDTEHPELVRWSVPFCCAIPLSDSGLLASQAVQGKLCSVKKAEPKRDNFGPRQHSGGAGNFPPSRDNYPPRDNYARDQGYNRGPPRSQGYDDRRRSPPRGNYNDGARGG